MKLSKLLVFPVILLSAFLLSACTHQAEEAESVETPSWTQTDDEDDTEDTETSETEDAEDEAMEMDETSEADESEDETDETLLASVSGEFCYEDGASVPPSLRVYLENNETGEYQYLIARGQSGWTFEDIEPGEYIVYLKGPEGSDLLEGRYTDDSGDFEVIDVQAEAEIEGIEPCDFDF